MALTYNLGTKKWDEKEQDNYLHSLKNEDGSPLSNEQLQAFKKAIQTNGLVGFDENGLMVMVVQPTATH